ncbi:MAG: MspI family type II restriction endonuclease, partial [Crocinitomicaceae bacterium]|nr:MspI family type II restriction endonuclease [Crocinitomicaceae bacterium]
DEELKKSDFIQTREKIKTKEYYCPATHLLTFSEFTSFLEGHKYDVLHLKTEEKDSKEKALTLMTMKQKGSYYGKRGNSYEKDLVSMLSDYNNLIKFKDHTSEISSTFKLVLKKILRDKGISINNVLKINASNSVPLLMNGGTPKTDIIITIETFDNKKIVETLSLKNTNKTRVSCHDYTAFDFIRILKCEKTKLADYFNYFQSTPSAKDLLTHLPKGYSIDEFTKLLNEKKDVFNNWTLRGMHDELNLTVPELQVSNYLLIKKGNDVSFYSMSEYIALITKKSKKVFGVPFGWTYPSKQRGKRIQLKVPVIM